MVALLKDELTERVLGGERVTAEQALALYHWPLEALGALANARRDLAKQTSYNSRGREIVTYIVDRNINYTNVCNVYCKFCAFYRPKRMRITTSFPANRLTKNLMNFPLREVFKS